MTRRTLAGRVLVGAGAAGFVGALLASVIGVRLLGSLDRSLADSVKVTAAAEDALAATVDVAATTDEATRVLEEGTSGLATGLTSARVLVVVLGVAGAIGQVAPPGIGLWLLDPERIARLLDV